MAGAVKNSEAGILLHSPAKPRRPEMKVSLAAASFPEAVSSQRRRLWDLHASLHCSIIGTCFSNRELRQVLGRIGCHGLEKRSDHDLHSLGVLLAGRQNEGARVLHKALDRKFRTTVCALESSHSAEKLKRLWADFLHRGDIPGAYWAVPTHPNADEKLVQHVFGEVHMLSHLVGASNRADIRRLKQLELENFTLMDKIAQQERQLRDSIFKRDGTIQSLRTQLADATIKNSSSESAVSNGASEKATTAELERKLALKTELIARSEERLADAISALSAERKTGGERDLLIASLRRELEIVERMGAEGAANEPPAERFEGRIVLYVGGRPQQVSHLRRAAEERGAEFLHHDGGVEETSELLPSLAAKADAIFFPVDCVSHGAVAAVKKICRHDGKPYIPLRSASVTSFVAGLAELAFSDSQAHPANETRRDS